MSSPRLHMFLIVSVCGAIGFFASYVLHALGVDTLWLRYLSAVAVAYVAFMVLLWCWLRFRADEGLDPSGLDVPSPWGASRPETPWEPQQGEFGGGGSS